MFIFPQITPSLSPYLKTPSGIRDSESHHLQVENQLYFLFDGLDGTILKRAILLKLNSWFARQK